MTIIELTHFWGWMTLLNIIMLFFAANMLLVFRTPVRKIHSKLTGLAEKDLPPIYLKVLACYIIMIFVFNLSPYLALRIVF